MKTQLYLLVALVLAPYSIRAASRVTVPLDGTWQIGESVNPDEQPVNFAHTVPVPGLVRLAQPGFVQVDEFESRELLGNLIRKGKLPESARTTAVGVSRQPRNYFWYRRTFRAPEPKEVALLRINKAQFGTAVWVNGRKVGEHAGCFTAGTFDISAAIDWRDENTVLVRVGAHPAAMPVDVPAGTDFEKTLWSPGIYDSVSLIVCDNPVVESVQVAPRVDPREIVLQTVLRNYGPSPRRGALATSVREWKGDREIGKGAPQSYLIEPGGKQTLTQTIPLPNARLWSTSDPFLHTATVSTAGDEAAARFGMREFRSDTATNKFYLNGRAIYLRGSNITLHRFFEDAACGARPWDEAWLQKLLVDLPRKMHWNSFRFCIGPVPQRWLDIADEAGLLIQHEYFIWTGAKPGGFHAEWTPDALRRELSEFVRDSWNHPSVAIWDACNETVAPALAPIINAVRPLDLSNRPWENGYNAPAGPDDPVENHPYEGWQGGQEWKIAQRELRRGDHFGGVTPRDTGHPLLINEYGWLWVNRDGTPTLLTENLYDPVLGKNAAAAERFEFNAYYLGALTEYWRAYRRMAGVLHFVYLTSSYPGAFTADHFQDVPKLELEPRFADYVSEAFKPLGLYVNLWRSKLAAGGIEKLPVMLVNDYDRPLSGRVALVLEDEAGRQVRCVQVPFALEPLGNQSLTVELAWPQAKGRYLLKATATTKETLPEGPTLSRRKVEIVDSAEATIVRPLEAAGR